MPVINTSLGQHNMTDLKKKINQQNLILLLLLFCFSKVGFLYVVLTVLELYVDKIIF